MSGVLWVVEIREFGGWRALAVLPSRARARRQARLVTSERRIRKYVRQEPKR